METKSRVLVVLLSLVLTACGDTAGLTSVGVDRATASCLLEQTEGRMDPDRLTDIVGERTEYSQAEADMVTPAFINCVG